MVDVSKQKSQNDVSINEANLVHIWQHLATEKNGSVNACADDNKLQKCSNTTISPHTFKMHRYSPRMGIFHLNIDSPTHTEKQYHAYIKCTLMAFNTIGNKYKKPRHQLNDLLILLHDEKKIWPFKKVNN